MDASGRWEGLGRALDWTLIIVGNQLHRSMSDEERSIDFEDIHVDGHGRATMYARTNLERHASPMQYWYWYKPLGTWLLERGPEFDAVCALTDSHQRVGLWIHRALEKWGDLSQLLGRGGKHRDTASACESRGVENPPRGKGRFETCRCFAK